MSEIEQMKERLDILEEKLGAINNKTTEKKTKIKRDKRPPTDYNIFMGKYIEEQKTILGSDFKHKTAFSDGAKQWSLNKK